MDTASRPPKRWGRWLAGVLLAIIGLSVFVYTLFTQPDRDIARLQNELRKEGLDISGEGRERPSLGTLAALGEQLQKTDRIPWRDKTPAQRAQHLKDTEQIYAQIKSVEFDAASGVDNLAGPMYATRAMQHCLHRTTFYLDTEPQKSLEALETTKRVAEELARQGHPLALTSYNLAYTAAVSRWANQPVHLEQVLALAKPDVDPLKVISVMVDEITLAGRSERFRWSWSPTELWENIDNHRGMKYLEREFLQQVLAIVKSAKSKSALDLAASASKPRAAVTQHAMVDKFLAKFVYGVGLDLKFLASAEITPLQCEAYIEMQRTDPKAVALPEREPFLDPFTGKSFSLHREGDMLWVMSAGPNGYHEKGEEDDIVAKFKLRPATPP